MRRIVVTGMGAVSPLGCGVELSWRRLLAGQSGLRPLPQWSQALPARIAGLVPDKADDADGGFDPAEAAAPKDQRKMDRFILFALLATAEAVAQAKWTPQDAASLERTATIIASGVGGFPAMAEAVRITEQRGPRRLSPFTIPSFLANLAAGHVSIKYGYKGALGTPVTACAAGVQAIGDAARMIRAGEADVAICGGAEACIDIVSLGGFAAARALSSSFNDEPARASRPFDRDRDGFVMGEGAGILVIEELEHALARGATPIAEIVGYGTTADAYHMTSGPPDGDGARRAMEIALRQANLAPTDLQHLNAHATSTPAGDESELGAIAALFGRNKSIAVSATKSATGHLLGAAGGLEAIFTVLALRDQIAPPTLNFENPDRRRGRHRHCRRQRAADADAARDLQRLWLRRRECQRDLPPDGLDERPCNRGALRYENGMIDTNFWLFLAAAVLIAAIPGPGIFYVAARTLSEGRASGFASTAGTALGGLVHVVAGSLGISAIILASAELFAVVKFVGALYLVWLGIKTFRSAGRTLSLASEPVGDKRAFRDGVLVEALNPKTAAFFLAFIPQFLDPAGTSPTLQFITLGAISVTLNTLADVVVVLMASATRAQLIGRPRLMRRLTQGSGVFIAGLGLSLALARRPVQG